MGSGQLRISAPGRSSNTTAYPKATAVLDISFAISSSVATKSPDNTRSSSTAFDVDISVPLESRRAQIQIAWRTSLFSKWRMPTSSTRSLRALGKCSRINKGSKPKFRLGRMAAPLLIVYLIPINQGAGFHSRSTSSSVIVFGLISARGALLLCPVMRRRAATATVSPNER